MAEGTRQDALGPSTSSPSTSSARAPAHAAESDSTTVAGTPIATTSDDQDSTPDTGASPESKPSTRSRLERSSDAKSQQKDRESSGRSRLVQGGLAVKKGSDVIRSRIASLVWMVAVLAAIVLAVGALLVALDANRDNAIVEFVLETAHKIDGPFWKVFEFTETKANGKVVHDTTKEVLVNWGLAAVAYLIAGRILDRIIRP